MVLATFAIRLLEGMFFVGLAGSAVVVLISFVEDFKEFSAKSKIFPSWTYFHIVYKHFRLVVDCREVQN
jgi:hypothetical protein